MVKPTYFYGKLLPQFRHLTSLPFFKGQKILAFSPHADDISIAAGGFLAQLAQKNTIIPILGFTGWRGVGNGVTKNEAILIREKEITQEAHILSFEKPLFLRLLSYDEDTPLHARHDGAKINDLIQKEKPDIVCIPQIHDDQPRHKQLTQLVRTSLQNSNHTSIFFYETPWRLFSPDDFNCIVPIPEAFFEKKIQAVSTHASQLARTDFVRLAKAIAAIRAETVGEQKIGGYGTEKIDVGRWVEVFSYEKATDV